MTERRADYSRLKPIMKVVQRSKKLELKLVVTGNHLLEYWGETKKVIQKDGFTIDEVLPIFTKSDNDDAVHMVKAVGKALIGFADIFKKLKPTIIFTGFDIGANFAAAVAGMHLNIHVSHIQGGERSGTIDEVLRHAMTKFSHIHFAATDESVKRIIKLGEDPKYVFNVGSPSLDTIKNIKYYPKTVITKKYNLDPHKRLIIFSEHPVTSEEHEVVSQINTSIGAIKKIRDLYNTETLVIYPNNDAGGRRVIARLKKSGIRVLPHIVYEDYLRLLKVADVLVGNSSTGIHEAPSFGLPTINIGSRQQFRERGENIIDVEHNETEIIKAIEKALFNKRFINKVRRAKNPYDNGNTVRRVVRILETIKLPAIQKVITY